MFKSSTKSNKFEKNKFGKRRQGSSIFRSINNNYQLSYKISNNNLYKKLLLDK